MIEERMEEVAKFLLRVVLGPAYVFPLWFTWLNCKVDRVWLL